MTLNEEQKKKIRQQDQKILDQMVAEALAKLQECVEFADERALVFYWDIAYGMGGTYVGRGKGEFEVDSNGYDDEFGWQASSMSC